MRFLPTLLVLLCLGLVLGPGMSWAQAETVRVRTGEHFDYSRLVFDFERSVGVKVAKEGGQAVIRFDRPVTLDLSRVTKRPPPWVGASAQRVEGNETVLRFAIAPNATLRDLQSGTKVVVDVRAPSDFMEEPGSLPPWPQAVAAAEPVAEPQPEPAPAPEAEAVPVAETPPAPGPEQEPAQEPTAAPDPQTKTATESSAAPQAFQQAEPPALPPPDQPAALEPEPPAPQTQAKAPEPAPAATPSQAPAQPLTQAPALPADPAAPPSPRAAPVQPVEESASAPRSLIPEGQSAAAPTPAATPAALQPEGGVIRDGNVTTRRSDSGITLRFDWDEPVAAAGFRRAGVYWIVFDKPARLDTNAIQASAGAGIPSVVQDQNPEGTVLRLQTLRGFNPTVSRDGLAWIFEFRQQGPGAPNPISIDAQPESVQGPRLFAGVGEPGKPIAVVDPLVGDNLAVVPVIPLGAGINDARAYPELQLLQATQGLVIAPLVDDVRVRSLKDGVEITTTGELALSPVSEEQLASTNLGSAATLSRVFNLADFRGIDVRELVSERQRLQSNIYRLNAGQERENAKLELARFYVSTGYEAEALGVLSAIARENEGYLDTAEYRALRGVSSLFMGRLDDARIDLFHPSLETADEGRFWQAALAYREDPLEEAGQVLRQTGSLTREYPKALRIPSGLIVTEAAVSLGDIELAEKLIEALNSDIPDAADQSRIDFVEGRLRELTGEFDEAISLWEGVMDGEHRPSRARAARARGELLYRLERISRAELLEELEKLRFAWRGDEFEFTLLRRLGDLYLEEGDYRNGLRSLRQAATHFRQNPEAPDITQKMADTFDALYLQGVADELPPVTAIALYDEFKELTPAGAKGDEMIRRLADRLVGVDLLDRAADLLQSQIGFRLQGELKARVGARLALVRLLARQPELALEALEESQESNIERELAIQRRHLRARALTEMEQGEAALGLLAGDKSADAELLRLDVYWQSQDWPNTAKTLNNVLRDMGVDKREPLDERQGEMVLNLAIAYTLAGNERGTARLRNDFGMQMMETKVADAFQLIADPENRTLIDYRSVADKVSVARNFQSFMEAYKQRLQGGPLSAIN
ncbi:MAG: tetratricopeptide repeat protein [Magnetovibrionaceae bacterium]